MLLNSEFLPICECAICVEHLPLSSIHAIIVWTSNWFCIFKLLLDILSDISTFLAFKSSEYQLWLDFSCPCYCSMDRHKSSKCHNLQISDLIHLREVIVSDLEVALFCILMAEIAHKLCYCLSQISLILVVRVNNTWNKAIIVELEL